MRVLGEGEDEAAVPELWGETSGSVTFRWHVSVVVCYSVFICTFNLLTINAKKLTFRMAGVFHKLSSFFYQSSILAPKMTKDLFGRFKYV